jgi:hypothetical protein
VVGAKPGVIAENPLPEALDALGSLFAKVLDRVRDRP